jgi:hypothetical protein
MSNLYKPFIPNSNILKDSKLIGINVGYTSFEVIEYYNGLDTISSLTKFLVSYTRVRKKKLKYSNGKFDYEYIPDKKFYGRRETLNGDIIYKFPISLYASYLKILEDLRIDRDKIEITLDRNLEYDKLNLTWNTDYILRDYQDDYINGYLSIKSPVGLLDMATGTGKTVTGCKLLHMLHSKFLVLVKGVYIEKWIEDVKKYFSDLKDEEIFVIRGYGSLEKLFNTKKEDLPYKVYIMSVTTSSSYIDSYENGDMIYDTAQDPNPTNTVLFGYDDGPLTITPDKFLNHLGVGVMLVDEMHQHYYGVYRTILYFNPIKVIGLTATLISNEKNMMNLYNVLLGEDGRISDKLEIQAYCDYETFSYNLPTTKRFKYNGGMGYMHAEFEKSIMSNHSLLQFYLKMIEDKIKKEYIDNRQEDDKAIIYIATIALCNIVKDYLSGAFPNISVDQYIGTDRYDKIMSADLCVTNVIKAGAALDIPNLIRVFMTIPMISNQANLQTYGRLRKLKDREVKFISFRCLDIEPHKVMENSRVQQLKNKIRVRSSETYFNQ